MRLAPRRSRRLRRSVIDDQLSLPLAWLSEGDFLIALQRRGVHDVRKVRFKENRSRMISVSEDRRAVNVHACFRAAPGEVIDAVASFVKSHRESAAYRNSIRRMRAWWEGQASGYVDGRGAQARNGGDRSALCCATPEQREFLRAMYERLNQIYFDGLLPTVPIRLSDRMSRRFGHVHYGRGRTGSRVIEEIALNVDLMVRGNEKHLLDTLLHEMSHVEAWIFHSHRDHGPVWRTIADRVGCEASACSQVRIRRRTRHAPVTHVPDIALRRISR
jgi:hypothetical protein